MFNVPYSPDYNGIETVWAFLKKDFRDNVLNIKTGEQEASTVRELVSSCIARVSREAVVNACRHATSLIMQA